MSRFQVGETRCVTRVAELVTAVLADRVRFNGLEAFMRELRKPRVFVHTDEAGETWTWLIERPSRLVPLDAGPGWPIAVASPRELLRSRAVMSSTDRATVSARTFAFGLEKEAEDGDVLVCGVGGAGRGFGLIERSDLFRLHMDCREIWRQHGTRIGRKLPEFGPEFEEWLLAARAGYRRISKEVRATPGEQLIAARHVVHAVLLYLALAANRGDFS